jgi:hypothetical protein
MLFGELVIANLHEFALASRAGRELAPPGQCAHYSRGLERKVATEIATRENLGFPQRALKRALKSKE